MTEPTAPWVNTTHDWGVAVDIEHLDTMRDNPRDFSPGGAFHLVLEVLA